MTLFVVNGPLSSCRTCFVPLVKKTLTFGPAVPSLPILAWAFPEEDVPSACCVEAEIVIVGEVYEALSWKMQQ